MKSVYHYKRGNHSESHVRALGSLCFSGSNRDCAKFLAGLRKFFREAYAYECYSTSLRDYVSYKMEPYFVYDD